MVFVSSGISAAQDSAIPILVTGINAAAAGIGDAGIGASQASFAAFWNPAGVADSRLASAREVYDGSSREGSANEIGVAHHIWIGNTRTYGLSGRFALGRRQGLGLFVIASDTGDDDTGQSGGTTGAQYLATGGTLAHDFGGLQIGMSAKFVSQRISSNTSRGVAFDFGVIMDLSSSGIRAGVSVLNLGKMSELAAVLTDLPATLRAGVAVYPFQVVAVDAGFPLLDLMFAVELDRDLNSDRTRWHVGASGVILETVIARVGYLTNDALRGLTVGLGLSYEAFDFDYAVVPFANGFGGPGHILTLSYGF